MSIPDQDIRLWESFRKGDREAFASLFRKYYPILIHFGTKFTHETDVLEDCIQELFIQLWQSKSQTEVLSVKAYLLKSLKYKVLKTLKKSEKQKTLSTIESVYEFSYEQILIERDETVQKNQKIKDALQQLSTRQKEIIYLKFYQGLSYEEVSEVMNINYQVCRNLLYQSVKALKKILSGGLAVALYLLF